MLVPNPMSTRTHVSVHILTTGSRDISALLHQLPNARVFKGSVGYDQSCQNILQVIGVKFKERYYGTLDYIEEGKLGHWCSNLRFARQCRGICVLIEDDIVLNDKDVIQIKEALFQKWSTPILALGPHGDTINVWNGSDTERVFESVRSGIDNPTDHFFKERHFYTQRNVSIGKLKDVTNSQDTSIIRSMLKKIKLSDLASAKELKELLKECEKKLIESQSGEKLDEKQLKSLTKVFSFVDSIKNTVLNGKKIYKEPIFNLVDKDLLSSVDVDEHTRLEEEIINLQEKINRVNEHSLISQELYTKEIQVLKAEKETKTDPILTSPPVHAGHGGLLVQGRTPKVPSPTEEVESIEEVEEIEKVESIEEIVTSPAAQIVEKVKEVVTSPIVEETAPAAQKDGEEERRDLNKHSEESEKQSKILDYLMTHDDVHILKVQRNYLLKKIKDLKRTRKGLGDTDDDEDEKLSSEITNLRIEEKRVTEELRNVRHEVAVLGDRYREGVGVKQSGKKAVDLYEMAAKRGDATAQSNLAIAYKHGWLGVTQSSTRAIEYYTLAANQGHATAQSKLGNMYYFGNGVETLYSKAREWWTKAAAQGNELAIQNLKILDEMERRKKNGQNVKEDTNKTDGFTNNLK
tara:strand:+ start:187 stop:2085 length:1899 start_codon:yes stop_codon:yes gene_type:complete